MYDTIKEWLPAELINESGYFNRVPTLLTNCKQSVYQSTNEVYFTGNLQGMFITVGMAGISLKGSLCKSYLDDNFKTLTRQDTQRAIEQLNDLLSLPVYKGELKQIDFAQNYIVDQTPENYYPLLGNSTHYKRLEQPKSIYYKNSIKTKLFYNKIAEGKTKGYNMPAIWQNKNVIRYELRYTSRIPQQFKTSSIQAQNLYNEMFYIDMVNRYISEWKNIYKNSTINFNLEKMNKPKDFFDQLLLLKIHEIGQNKVFEIIEQLKTQNVFEHKEYYSRLKSDIKKLCTNNAPIETNELIQELDTKIKRVKDYCR